MTTADREKLSELLSAYVDGEVSVDERRLVEETLRTESWARRLLGELQYNSSLVSSLPRHAAPPTVISDIQARLERQALINEFDDGRAVRLSTPKRFWPRGLAMAAALGLAVAVSWWWLGDRAISSKKPEVVISAHPAILVSNAKEAPTVEKDLLAAANSLTLEDKLASGALPKTLAAHVFDAERMRLQVDAGTPKEGEAVADRLLKNLESQNIAPLERLAKATPATLPQDSRFYVSGKSGVNFSSAEQPQQQQILVRAPRSQVDAMLAVLPETKISDERVQLRTPSFQAKGVEAGRQILQVIPEKPDLRMKEKKNESRKAEVAHLDSAAPAPPPKEFVKDTKKPPRPAGYFGGLLGLLGVDPALLGRGDTDDSAKPGEGRVAIDSSEKSASDVEEGNSGASADAPAPSIIARNLRRVDRGAERKVSAPAAGAARPSGTPAARVREEFHDPHFDDPLITLVIEVNTPTAQAPAKVPVSRDVPKDSQSK